MDFTIRHAKLVEIPIVSNGAGATLSFPTNMDDLNKAKIYGLQVITSTQLTTSPTGRPVFSAANQVSVAVTLTNLPGSNKRLDTIPAYSFNRELNAGRFYEFTPFIWNPSSSEINILAAGLNTTDSILFVFYYDPID